MDREQQTERIAWLKRQTIKTIRIGSNRAELLVLFTPPGGISARTRFCRHTGGRHAEELTSFFRKQGAVLDPDAPGMREQLKARDRRKAASRDASVP